jgi:hypothetical protein
MFKKKFTVLPGENKHWCHFSKEGLSVYPLISDENRCLDFNQGKIPVKVKT